MELKFLGNDSGFTDSHNNAFYVYDSEVVFIDLSMLNIQKALKVQEKYNSVNIIVTHMHDDHVSGIGLFAQYLYYCYHKTLKIFVPNSLFEDMRTELKIKGINMSIIDLNIIENGVLGVENVINTKHTLELDGKCFGYTLKLNGTRIVYTGDTCNLQDFENYLIDCDEFYVDCSYKYGVVHLKWSDIKDKIVELSSHMFVYLMHIDDESIELEIKKLENNKICVVNVIDKI